MICTRFVVSIAAITIGMGNASWTDGASRQETRDRREKFELSMKVTPQVGFAPMRVSAIAELKGEPEPKELETLYCAAVEWDWGDETRSEQETDCEPYEVGKTELKRRYSAQHTYNESGRYRIYLRLKRNNRVVLAASGNVQIRPSAREWGQQQ